MLSQNTGLLDLQEVVLILSGDKDILWSTTENDKSINNASGSLSWVRDILISTSLDDIRGVLVWSDNTLSSGSIASWVDAERMLLSQQGIPLLTGTETYFELVESFDRLWVVPRMVFSNNEGMYFGLLQTGSYDRTRIARSLKWNALAFMTEKDILSNSLPWKRVTFINIPEYKEKLVIMVVDTGTQRRIVQLPKKYYHQSKDKLKNILWSSL